jgi:hypothetical protein
MIKNQKNKTYLKTLTFLLIILIPSVFMMFPRKTSDTGTDFNDLYHNNEIDSIPEFKEIINNPQSSKISNDPWWNGSWRYRQLINVTNPNTGVIFTNYTTTLVFNYTQMVADDQMNGDLSDIRIVQNGVLRKYWYQKDYPETDLATVWFDCDIGQAPNHIDTEKTFLYFNGSSLESTDPKYFMDTASTNRKDAFGWIRNGHFELEPIEYNTKITGLHGWEYSNEASDIYDDEVGAPQSNPYYQHNLTTYNDYQMRTFGDWSFKWGSLDHYLDDADPSNDFEGTLYSYPFIVPTVSGTSYDLELTLYRNVRFYTEQNHLMGHYLWLCDGSSYSSNIQSHSLLEPEAEVEHWWSTGKRDFTYAIDDEGIKRDTRNQADPPPFSNDGYLTGTVTIDIPDSYMGELLFLVIGTYGKESQFQSAFTQVDNVTFNYNIHSALNDEIQEVAGEVTFITKDVDGRIVPNAEVTIIDGLGQETGPYDTTEEDGSASFSNVPYGLYNVTVNYSLPYSGLEEVMYDSRVISEEYLIDGSGKVYELELNMSTIDFEIVDYGGYPLTYGFINISNTEDSAALDILQLENDGKVTFQWLNQSRYYFKVYYNNTDFFPNPTLLNASFIYRDNYAKTPDGKKHQRHTFDINEKNQAPPSEFYNVKERIYTNWSTTEISDIKLINVSISIQNNEFLKNVSVYYIDSSDNTDTLSHRIYFDDSYVGETSDTISIDLMTVVNSKLSSENRLAYGLLIDVWGVNSSTCTGDIKVNMTEAMHVYNKTAISKLNIRVLGAGATISDAIVSIKSNSPIFGQVVNTILVSDKSRDSYAFSEINDLPFMYLRGYYYNFSVVWGEPPNDKHKFNVTISDQWTSDDVVLWYNYSVLDYNKTLEFDIDMEQIDPDLYLLKFDNLTAPDDVVWGNNVTYQVYFNQTTDNWDPLDTGPCTSPDSIQLKIMLAEDLLFTFNMDPTGTPGYYKKEFNSSIISAGTGGVFYKIVITGSKSPYTLQGDELTTLFVEGKSTVLTLHDYKSPTLEEIADDTVSEHFGELVNITVRFYNDTNNPLMDATIAFDWLNLGYNYTGFQPDPINPGYFTLTLNTGKVEVVGTRTIMIIAIRENYASQIILISLRILERPTTLNGQTGLVYSNPKIWVQKPDPYNFTYRDSLSTNIEGDLDVAIYSWQKLDENGNIIPGESGTGSLSQNPDNIYTLDFNTQLRPVGTYQIYVTLQKNNYEERFALINLEIQLREFDADLDATNLDDDQVIVVKGKDVKFEIELFDETRDNIPLRGAKVVLEIGDEEYEFDEDDPGIYTYTFSTEEIDAFYTSQTFTGQIIIKKVNFTSEEIDITIVVEMEEIFDGMPTFYLILLVALIGGIIGSLVSYRVIQQARIPGFVKKIRKVKNTIKAKKPITESYSIPTMEQMILKQFGPDWKAIGFSLEDNLGIKDLKSKSSTEENKITKVRGENN